MPWRRWRYWGSVFTAGGGDCQAQSRGRGAVETRTLPRKSQERDRRSKHGTTHPFQHNLPGKSSHEPRNRPLRPSANFSTNQLLLLVGLFTIGLVAATAVQADYQPTAKILPPAPDDTDRFGTDVAISGNRLVVGEPRLLSKPAPDRGTVYLFDRTTQNQLLAIPNPDPAVRKEFGLTVDIDGNHLMTAATGAAYLYDATTGNQLHEFDVPVPGSGFGGSVAVSGNRAMVGSIFEKNGCVELHCAPGAAFVFDTATGNEVFKLVGNDTDAEDHFGTSVALDGSVAVIGAAGDDPLETASFIKEGAAYIFDVSTGSQLFKIPNPTGEITADFGRSVAVSGTTAIIGAPGASSAYLYDTTTGNQLFELTPSDGTFEFGWSVDIDGDRAIVGSRDRDNVFIFDTITGAELQLITAFDGATQTEFGFAVAIEGDTALIGARLDSETESQAGAAYVYAPPVPEPSTYAMAALALVGLALYRWRRAPRAAFARMDHRDAKPDRDADEVRAAVQSHSFKNAARMPTILASRQVRDS
ncbi:MAG: PEP-CTERM sorting domain-containing protein [Planctomycetota bacterium]|nr:MAG: PEP-CTERM sorting domain-containing protein [Planctomycetota bacterium]REK40169.1 MAG: PEP-CTERM sorting domain-containing protein [Planctomycetota bacterium]